MFLKGKKQPNLRRATVLIAPEPAHLLHFKNAAAKRKGRELYGDDVLDMQLRMKAAQDRQLDMSLFKPVEIRIGMWARLPIGVERQAGPRTEGWRHIRR